MEIFDNLDMWEWELDNRFNNILYSPTPTNNFNPESLFTAPDGHIFTPDEFSNMMNMYSTPNTTTFVPDFNDLQLHQQTMEVDPNGGVIVTDIFGGIHHYSDMNQAIMLTDFLSGLPITEFNHMPVPMYQSDNCDSCPNLPTDVHTPVDLSFYDNQIDDARQKLYEATKEIENSTDYDSIEIASRRADEARHDIQYWEDCRRRSEQEQTIDNIQSDRLTNETNQAINDLHTTLHHK